MYPGGNGVMGFTAFDKTGGVLIDRPPTLTQNDGFVRVHRSSLQTKYRWISSLATSSETFALS